VRAMARSEDVEQMLLAEWAISQPALAGRSSSAALAATTKGWRWVAEMEEIAATMASVGLPDGFHQAAAEIFRRSPRTGQEESRPAGAGPGDAHPGQPRAGNAHPGDGPSPGPDGGPIDLVLAALTGDATAD
jgi:hypothetical protein